MGRARGEETTCVVREFCLFTSADLTIFFLSIRLRRVLDILSVSLFHRIECTRESCCEKVERKRAASHYGQDKYAICGQACHYYNEN